MKLTILFFTLCAFSSPIDKVNNPDNIRFKDEAPYSRKLSELSLEGQSEFEGWSDEYWATVHRGTARMWQGEFDPTAEDSFFTVQMKTPLAYDYSATSLGSGYTEKMSALREKMKAINEDLDLLTTFTEMDIFLMPELERDKLPPAMKLDLVNYNYDYPLTKYELDRTRYYAKVFKDAEKEMELARQSGDENGIKAAQAKMDEISWFGICHGWAPVSAKYPQAQRCYYNDGGTWPRKFNINFMVSDVNAVLSLLQADFNEVTESGFVARRCNTAYGPESGAEKHRDRSYTDINPGSYHIILGNKIGRDKKTFTQDITIDQAVWNQNVVKYEAEIEDVSEETLKFLERFNSVPDKEIAPETVRQVSVKNKVTFIVEVPAHVEQMTDTSKFYQTETLNYLLELDKNDDIIGGRWLGESAEKHPDFAWDQNKADPLSNKANKFFGKGMRTIMDQAGL